MLKSNDVHIDYLKFDIDRKRQVTIELLSKNTIIYTFQFVHTYALVLQNMYV
jgi:hypothetical protein